MVVLAGVLLYYGLIQNWRIVASFYIISSRIHGG